MLEQADRARLLEAAFAFVADGVIVVDAGGLIVYMNEAGRALAQRAPTAQLPVEQQSQDFRLRFLDGRPVPPEATPLGQALRGETVRGFELLLGLADGSDLVLSNTASPMRDAQGQIIGAVAVFRDVTAQKRAEETLHAAKQRLEASVAARTAELQNTAKFPAENPYPVLRLSADGTILYANASSDTLLREWGSGAGQRAPAAWQARARDALAAGSAQTIDTPCAGRLLSFMLIPIPDMGYVNLYGRDVTESRHAEDALAFISESGAALAESLDYQTTLARIARLAIPRLADWCVLSILEPGGALRHVAIACAEPAKQPLARQLQQRYVPSPQAPQGIVPVIRSRKSLHVRDVDEDLLAAAAGDESQLDLLHALGPRSVIIAPLEARGEVLGVLSLVYAQSDRRYDPEDVFTAEELARRAAVAIDNARLYAAEREARSAAEAARSEAAFERDRLQAILNSMVDEVWFCDTDGNFTLLNETIGSSIGLMPASIVEQPVVDVLADIEVYTPDGQPRPAEESPMFRAVNGETMRDLEEIVRHKRTGRLRYRLANVAPVRTADNRIVGAVATVRDITERKHAEERVTRLQMLTAALSSALTPKQVAEVVIRQCMAMLGAQTGAVALLCDEGTHLEIIEALGYPESVTASWEKFSAAAAVPVAEAVRTGEPVLLRSGQECNERFTIVPAQSPLYAAAAAFPLVAQGRTVGGMVLGLGESHEFEEDEVAFLLALANLCAQALDRAQLFEAEQRARAGAERAQQQAALLAEVSRELAASLDYETTLANVVRLPVPAFADYCALHLTGEDSELPYHAHLAHVNTEKQQRLQELLSRQRVGAGPGSPAARVLASGRAEFAAEVPEQDLPSYTSEGGALEIARLVGVRSFTTVPITTRKGTIGALSFAFAESGRHYGPDDVPFAEELGRRAAVAIDNARLYQETQEALRLRERFMADASHELRTPITIIRGYIQGMQRQIDRQLPGSDQPGEPSPDRVSLDLGRMQISLRRTERALRRLSALVDEMLDVNRYLQNRSLTLRPEPFDLVALVFEVIQSEQSRRADTPSSHTVEFRLDLPGEPLWGVWDRARVEQVLVDLIDNAVKYSPERGRIQVCLTTEPEHAGRAGPWAHLTVADHGIGIPADQLELVFRPFFRASNVSARNYQGLGIGLAISKEIVEQHHGALWAESAGEHQGSTLHVVLPLQPARPPGTPC